MVQTNKQKFLKHFNLPDKTMLSVEDISNLTGIPSEVLDIVFKRGFGAWRTSPQSIRVEATGKKDPKAPRTSKMGPQRWAAARVYSFVMGGPTFETADSDLAKKYGIVPVGK
jgi:hypothetical protein